MTRDDLRQFRLEREGLSLAAYEVGEGLPFVFQHGLCGDIGQVAEAFPDGAGLKLVGLECRGHGASEAGNKLSIRLFADDVIALIERVGAPVLLGGISMGAAIASRIAIKLPDLVRGLALVRPAWVTEAAPDNLRPNAEVGALLSRLPATQAREAFVVSETYGTLAREAPDNLASIMGFFERQPIEVTARLLSAIANDGPGVSEADLRALAIPTLVVGTAQDFIHPLALARRLAGLIPNAGFVEITPKGVDKAAYVSELHAALRAFVKGL